MTDGEKLKSIRKALKLRQEDLAPLIDIEQGSVSNIENNKPKTRISAAVKERLIGLGVNKNYIEKGELPILIKNSDLSNINPEKTVENFTQNEKILHDETNKNNYMTHDEKSFYMNLVTAQQKSISDLTTSFRDLTDKFLTLVPSSKDNSGSYGKTRN